ncbi:uncharacterized protein LOC113305812 [Papaver somniferum]|uniref:uncharacterized protein LOC113305812 n=1 Tax=Papaver somniferum TaxID=3469 RepID=UPI000E7060DE|nr:uncharacterized protein LOC113305812 [Papaver somniferum]
MNASLLSDSDPENIELLDMLVTARGKHEIASQQYNTLMQAKSRVKWVKGGGANTVFFHANMRVRQAQNVVSEIEDNDVLTEEDNVMMDAVPSCMEIKNVVFGMDANSSPGPDGFPRSIYKFAWDVVGQDLVGAIQYCWRCRFIPKGLNSNFLFLLPKVKGAKKADQFRPIGLANFSFKVITRIVTTRLSSLVTKLVSCQQGAFIKAYDSLRWEFLFEVLSRFGFSEEGINWLRILFISAKISALVNGGPCGFVGFSRGLRQGDPLSPILFVIAEEVLSRNLTQMVQEGKIQAVVQRNGQVINKRKSKCFIGGTTDVRRKSIAEHLQMELYEFPDKYLGVILNPGRVKVHQVWGILEMMQDMLASWKAANSSINWSNSVDELEGPYSEKIIRNFLWTEDPATKKLVTVKCEEVNAHISDGGLGIRRLEVVNNALLMKLTWRIMTEDEEWTRFMRDKFMNKKGEWTKSYKQSSIWSGLKWVIQDVDDGSRWMVGNGRSI